MSRFRMSPHQSAWAFLLAVAATLIHCGSPAVLLPIAQATPVVLRGQLLGRRIKVRAKPDVQAAVVAQHPMGVVAQRLDQRRQFNGRIWGDLLFADGSRGWVPLDYWRPVDRLGVVPSQENPIPRSVPGAVAATPHSSSRGVQPARWTGRLISAESNDEIRVYLQPDAAEPPRYLAPWGDRVQIFDSRVGSDGYLWYHVSLSSFLQGWVRADQVQQVRDVLR